MAELYLLNGSDPATMYYEIAYSVTTQTKPNIYEYDPHGTTTRRNGRMKIPVDALETNAGIIEFMHNYMSKDRLYESNTVYGHNLTVFFDDENLIGYCVFEINPVSYGRNKLITYTARKVKHRYEMESAAQSAKYIHSEGIRMTTVLMFTLNGQGEPMITDIVKMPRYNIPGLD
jgi:hypothetical protein